MQVGYDPEKAYYRSKLALLIYAKSLSRQYPPENLTVNTFEPGMTKTDFSRDFQGVMKWGSKLMKIFMHGPEVPAKTAIYLALDESLKNISGQNYENMKVKVTSPQSQDIELAQRLWEETQRELQSTII
jgi:NAD(P)-dependent dehydrogenase (short-subunit alcohol dehydrogenase family)